MNDFILDGLLVIGHEISDGSLPVRIGRIESAVDAQSVWQFAKQLGPGCIVQRLASPFGLAA